MAEHNQLYQHAVYYDVALRRDVGPEVDFLCDAYHHYSGFDLKSVLDIACGPGYHAREFARREITTCGLDLHPEMLQFAAEQAAQDGVMVTWLAADMRDFCLEKPVDLAICMFDGIDALTDNDDIICHFRSVATSLKPSGLYILDYTHPRDCTLANYGSFRYAGERAGIKVEIVWATNKPIFDPVTGVAYVEAEMHVDDHGEKQVIKDAAYERLITPQELTLLARLSGVLKPVGWHGSFDISQPLDNSPASHRLIMVMQKGD